jgi:hypothetical protein
MISVSGLPIWVERIKYSQYSWSLMGEITSLVSALLSGIFGLVGVWIGLREGHKRSKQEQMRQENKKKGEIASFFEGEIELIVLLVRLFGRDLDSFEGKATRIAEKIKPYKIYDSYTFNMLPEIGPELLTKIRAFYCLTQLKIMSLDSGSDWECKLAIEALSSLEGWPKISKEPKEGWEDLEKAGAEIIESLKEIYE